MINLDGVADGYEMKRNIQETKVMQISKEGWQQYEYYLKIMKC